MKCILVVCGLLFATFFYPQLNNRTSYIKVNTLFLPVGVLNGGAEFQISDKNTIQADVFISPWKSVAGEHAQLYFAVGEFRHYLKGSFSGFYGGLNLGAGIYNMTKWDHFRLHQYEAGFTFLLGASAGYQWTIAPRWNLDAFIGGGISQSQYKGYQYLNKNLVFRYDGARGWNKSGELLPYRGGLMLSYKIR